jgi:tetratricopeptide (TPR) repeat protein
MDPISVKYQLARTLDALGELRGDNAALAEAISIYQTISKEVVTRSANLDVAKLQTDYGNALRKLGERESGTTRLEEAIRLLQNPAGVSNVSPSTWAENRRSLAFALARLGERKSGVENLEKAVSTYREILAKDSQIAPLDWAMTQNNLGTALQKLGGRESGTERLVEAITAYHEAFANAPESVCRSTGRRRRTTSAMPF